MTLYQDKAVWELRRQGFQGVAVEAQQAWERGEGFAPKEPLPLALEIKELIRIANWETGCQAA